MARVTMDMGTYDGVNITCTVDDDNIEAGTLTVPGILTLKNENPHPVTEIEGQLNSRLNIMPSNFSFKRINPQDAKIIHLLINVPQSTLPGDYEIKLDLDFKIDIPARTTRAVVIKVKKGAEEA